jgi:hypothetical protein
MQRCLSALEQLTSDHPTDRKLLLAPDINYARELLFALARRTGGWIGWEAATLRNIADELAFVALGATDHRAASDVETTAMVSAALDAAIVAGAVSTAFAELSSGLGFRAAVRDALLELRTAGVNRRGLPGRLFERLVARGAQLLFSEAIIGLTAPEHLSEAAVASPPASSEVSSALSWIHAPHALPGDAACHLDLFHAATPGDEIREVLRRVLGENLPWDAVEIVATDPDTYGMALDALCQRVDLQVSLLAGIPLARTRIGRALERWFVWLADGLPADVLRTALEATELKLPEHQDVSATRLRTS